MEMWALLLQLASTDLRCASASDCTAVPAGHKACGGPSRYVVTSIHNAALDQMHKLAAQLIEIERAMNERGGIVSNCRVVQPPLLQCVQRQCLGGPPPPPQSTLSTTSPPTS